MPKSTSCYVIPRALGILPSGTEGNRVNLMFTVLTNKILSSVFGKDSALSANAQRIVVTSFAHLIPETLLTKFALRTRVRSFQVASSG